MVVRLLFYILLFGAVSCTFRHPPATLYVGTYTQKGSKGIYQFRFDRRTGVLQPAGHTGGVSNPSFLTLSPDQRFLYAVEETDPGKIGAYRIHSQTGALTPLNTRPTGGAHPCHVTTDPGGHCVLAGNYSGGNLAAYRIQSDGQLSNRTALMQHEGKSVHPQRQEKAHVHSVNVAPNGRDVWVADLGMDQLVAYQLDTATCQLTPGNPPFVRTAPGSGPRHFDFHPDGRFAYTVLELTCMVEAFRYESGQLTSLQTLSTLPSSYKGQNTCADIHVSPDGRFLYASNRGHNSIVAYAIDPASGRLSLVGHTPVGGSTPRNFIIDASGKYLLVANQDSDNVRVFKRDKKTGTLTDTGHQATVSMPVCLKMRG